MAHAFAEEHFNAYEDVEKWISEWIVSKDESFFRRGIRLLPERWKKVIANDEQYFDRSIFSFYFLNKIILFAKKRTELSN